VALQPSERFAYQPLRLAPTVLETVMVDRRPDLRAAQEEYEQSQQALRLAYIQRIPWFRFGPSYERDGGAGEGSINKLGVGVGIDIPLANLNRGELLRLEAARDKLREAFVARVHAARAEVAQALRALRAQERLVRLFEDVIRPALDESAQLTDAALELGDVNVLQFVTAQSKVLKGRREAIETTLEYWNAVFDLERALGARVAEVEGREE
jgi:outer membrane protein TolC